MSAVLTKDPNDFEESYRPNYEQYSAICWILSAVGALYMALYLHLPAVPFYVVSLFSLGMCLYRLIYSHQLNKKSKLLKGVPITGTTLKETIKHIHARKDAIWIGKGFDWKIKHAQATWELIDKDLQGHDDDHLLGDGFSWLHGLEGKEKDIYLPLRDANLHTLIVGTTGMGKTKLYIHLMTQAILRRAADGQRESVIIFDPKGDPELMRCAKKACEIDGDPNRFLYFHPAFPEDSIRLNPLKNYNRATEIASRIAALVPSETGSDPFKAFAQMALNNIIQGMILTGTQPTLVGLRSYLEGGKEGLLAKAIEDYGKTKFTDAQDRVARIVATKRANQSEANLLIAWYRKEIKPQWPNPDLEGLISTYEHDKTHFSKMVASLLPIMTMLTSAKLGPLLSPTNYDEQGREENDLASIIREGKVIYIGLDSLSDAMVSSALGSILMADLASVAGDRYNFGIGGGYCNVLIDEASEIINETACIQLLNKGRGAKIRMNLATQALSDLVARLGNDAKAEQILGNTTNVIMLRSDNVPSQDYFCNTIPKIRAKYIMKGQGMSTGSDNPLMFTGNSQERLMHEEADLVPPAIIGRLPTLEYFARISGGRIIKGRIPILSEETMQL